ncbi:hypothetical protein PVK06_023468 [Gossypium arboreum]|uniref:RNase H type-1 domain-containing protein n=1 Tax=Gossypium arboreum TaxID=29729 RepID=A0ABR0PB87_GOSAR|nr:hypothetical protein PVK06_023468 [Gossypium arboreum]
MDYLVDGLKGWAEKINRNRFIHEGKIKKGAQIAGFVENHLKELDGLRQSVPVERLCVTSSVAPEGSRFKINFDAAINNHRKESCSGLVIRNAKTEVICSKTVINSNILSVFAAEAVPCFQALQLGLQLDLREVEIKGDSRTVIRKL